MFEKLLNVIKDNESIVIYGHIDPDGDCFGSQVALKEALKNAFPNKKIFIAGSGLPRFSKLLGTTDSINDETCATSLSIILDGNDCDRMEDKRCKTGKAFVKFDHHIISEPFPYGPFYVDTDATSTCEIIYSFLKESHFEINSLVANALFLGLVTDTGKFTFVKDFNKIFKIAGDLCSLGANPSLIYKCLNITYENELAFKGYLLNNYKKTDDGIIYCLLTNELIKKYKLSSGKAGSFVNLLSNVEGYGIWLLGVGTDDGKFHYEIRSSGADIQKVVILYGGGGHKCAAGYTVNEFSQENFDDLLKNLSNSLKEYQGR